MNKMKTLLITGGAGFVGRHAIDAALKKGFAVRVLDNFSTSRREALDSVKQRIKLIEGDIRDPKIAARAMKGVHAVFHLAAIRSVMRSVEDPFLAHEVNATGTLVLLEAARAAGVKHFLFASTSAVYGDTPARRQSEAGPLRPISPYGAAKLAAEMYARHYSLEKGLPTTSIRIFNVYGPRQNPESKYSLVVPGLLSKILKGERPKIDGTGKQSRDFVYIGDVLEAFFRALGNRKSHGKVYNVGSGRTHSINDLASTLIRLAGSRLKPEYGPRRGGDPDVTCANVRAIGRELGWRPRTGLERGLKETTEWAIREKSAF